MNIKQIEKNLKHSLKEKISINKNTIFKYLMCGLAFLSFSGLNFATLDNTQSSHSSFTIHNNSNDEVTSGSSTLTVTGKNGIVIESVERVGNSYNSFDDTIVISSNSISNINSSTLTTNNDNGNVNIELKENSINMNHLDNDLLGRIKKIETNETNIESNTNALREIRANVRSVKSETLNVENGGAFFGNSNAKIELKENSIENRHLNGELREKINKIDNKLNTDLSNLNVNELINKVNNGTNISTPTNKLVTDRDVNNYLTNYYNRTEVNDKINEVVNKDFISNKLETRTIESETLNVVNGGAFFGNSNAKIEIKNNSINSNHIQNGVITNDKLDNNINEKINSIDSKLNKDLSNIEKGIIINKVGNGNLETPNGDLVSDRTVNNYLNNNYYNKSNLDNKLNEKLNSNLSNLNENAINNKLAKGTIISTDLVVTGGNNTTFKNVRLELSQDIKDNINNKLNKNGNNANENEKEEFRNNFNLYSKNDVDRKIQLAQFSNVNFGDIKINENNNGKITGASNVSLKDIDFKDNKWRGTLATQGQLIESNTILNNEIDNVKNSLNNVENKIIKNDKMLRAGIASAAAMANIPQINESASNKYNLAVGFGNYRGENSVAVGLSGVSDDGRVVYKTSVALDSEKHLTTGLGVGYQFGKRNIMPNELDRLKTEIKVLNSEKDSKINQLEEKIEKLEQIIKGGSFNEK